MAVAKQKLTVYQGADYQRVLTLKDESGVPMDITGYTFRGQARVDYSSSSASLTFGFTVRTQSGDDVGRVDMLISSDDTSALGIVKKTNYLYDIEMVDTGAKVTRIVEGQLELIPEVTK